MSKATKCPVDIPFGSKCSVDVAWVDIPSRHRIFIFIIKQSTKLKSDHFDQVMAYFLKYDFKIFYFSLSSEHFTFCSSRGIKKIFLGIESFAHALSQTMTNNLVFI
jgi:hypothetical protein